MCAVACRRRAGAFARALSFQGGLCRPDYADAGRNRQLPLNFVRSAQSQSKSLNVFYGQGPIGLGQLTFKAQRGMFSHQLMPSEPLRILDAWMWARPGFAFDDILRKMTVSQSGDSHEIEADNMARAVIQQEHGHPIERQLISRVEK